MIAVAHAGCFTMFLAFILDDAKLVADQLTTKAALTLEMSPPGSFEITAIELTLTAKIRAIDQATLRRWWPSQGGLCRLQTTQCQN
jgi:lipoyl-dependent peroxiredoxin